eukprot:6104329-Pleurochrysis_carterae.AAC.1
MVVSGARLFLAAPSFTVQSLIGTLARPLGAFASRTGCASVLGAAAPAAAGSSDATGASLEDAGGLEAGLASESSFLYFRVGLSTAASGCVGFPMRRMLASSRFMKSASSSSRSTRTFGCVCGPSRPLLLAASPLTPSLAASSTASPALRRLEDVPPELRERCDSSPEEAERASAGNFSPFCFTAGSDGSCFGEWGLLIKLSPSTCLYGRAVSAKLPMSKDRSLPIAGVAKHELFTLAEPPEPFWKSLSILSCSSWKRTIPWRLRRNRRHTAVVNPPTTSEATNMENKERPTAAAGGEKGGGTAGGRAGGEWGSGDGGGFGEGGKGDGEN